MNPLGLLTSNYIINVGFLSWAIAQLIKTIRTFFKQKKIDWERMIGAGGMPSSHSALVCSVAVGMAKKVGFASPEFALAIVLAGIVMYDAMGVRRAAGEHAKLLNEMTVDFKTIVDIIKEDMSAMVQGDDQKHAALEERRRKALKEFIGHTPLEVFCGALLGILIAVLMPVK